LSWELLPAAATNTCPAFRAALTASMSAWLSAAPLQLLLETFAPCLTE
jgi:hypothetical protein